MTFTKEEWKAILSVPKCCLKVDVYKSIEKHGFVIKNWVEGGILERRTDGGVWEEIKEFDKHLCFTPSNEYRIQPEVELSFTLSQKQAQQLVWVLENTSFDSADSRKVRNLLIKNLNYEIQKEKK